MIVNVFLENFCKSCFCKDKKQAMFEQNSINFSGTKWCAAN